MYRAKSPEVDLFASVAQISYVAVESPGLRRRVV